MKLRHFIVTRFNVAYDFAYSENPPPATQRLDDSWLDERAKLFRTFTAPSVRQQSSVDFWWHVCIDVASPSWLADVIYAEGAAPIRCKPGDWLHAERKLLEAVCDPGDLLMTTRLDSDDALDRDFVARLRITTRSIVGGVVAEPQFYDPERGYTFDARTGELRLHEYQTGASPFCTAVELRGKELPATVYCKPHHLVEPCRYGGVRPQFLQVCYGGNVANVPGEGELVVDAPTIMKERFGVQL